MGCLRHGPGGCPVAGDTCGCKAGAAATAATAARTAEAAKTHRRRRCLLRGKWRVGGPWRSGDFPGSNLRCGLQPGDEGWFSSWALSAAAACGRGWAGTVPIAAAAVVAGDYAAVRRRGPYPTGQWIRWPPEIGWSRGRRATSRSKCSAWAAPRRACGSLRSSLRITGHSVPARIGGSGSSPMIAVRTAFVPSRSKGGRPSTAAYSVAPSDHRSAAGVAGRPPARSGATMGRYRPDHHSRRGQSRAAVGDGGAEAGEHDLVFGAEQYVARLHVAVHDTGGVRRPDGSEDLQADPALPVATTGGLRHAQFRSASGKRQAASLSTAACRLRERHIRPTMFG